MRTTVDIPDPLYVRLQVRAAREGKTIRELILKGVEGTLEEAPPREPRVGEPPVIRAKNPGSLKLGPEGVYEYIPFP